MRFSIQIFGLPPEHFGPVVAHADQLGFETAWMSDHVLTPLNYEKRYPYSDDGDPGYRLDTPLADVTVTLAYLAALTKSIHLAAGVFVLPLRNPFHAASAWGTIQNLSMGRAVLGVGSGWMEEEFDAIGEPFARRGKRLDEMLDVLDLLWSGEEVQYSGEHYEFKPLRFGVTPTEPIPLVFGGHGKAALRRAARRGSGWFGPNVDLETSQSLREAIEGYRRSFGKSDDFAYYVRLHGELTPELVRSYSEAGFEHGVISPFAGLGADATVEDRVERLSDIAARVGLSGDSPSVGERQTP